MRDDSPLRPMKHVIRAAILLVVALVLLVVFRSVLVPETWGQYGAYRASNVPEQLALPVHHGGDASCRPCHEEQWETHDASAHVVVRCELCHAPVSGHATADAKVADMPTHREADLCLDCHRPLDARPDRVPQIQAERHVREMGGEPGPEACFDCHDPHEPL